MDFYPPLEFENCGRHREPKFYTGYPDNAVHKRCTAICYILRNLENMGLQGERGDPGSKNKFGLYQSPTCHGVTTFYRLAKSLLTMKM